MSDTQLAAESASKPPADPDLREVIAWAFYDFANSGYTTVVLTAIYGTYFVAVVAGPDTGMASGTATFLWTLAIAIANFCVLVSAPIIGAIADFRASKKKFLWWTTAACVSGTALMAAAGPGDVALGMILLIIATIAFSAGENLIAAFLPEIASPSNMGRISGYGWSLGYFGGLLTLGTCLFYINWASGLGQEPSDYVPVTLIITAGIFALSAAPTFIYLRERAVPRERPIGVSYWRLGLDEVGKTLRNARHFKDLFRFIVCLTAYQSGVATVIVIAAIYAQAVMGFDSQQLIILIMVVNLTASIGAFVFGMAQDRYGSVPTLAAGLLVWLAAIGVTYFAESPSDVWLAGNLMGLAMGATQAGGRALIGQLTPVERSAEFFGLWGFASRAAAIIGPLSYGVISYFSNGDHRMAMLSTAAFFLVGLVLLFTVDEKRGVEARKNDALTVQ